MQHYRELIFYYVFLPSKFKLPANTMTERATITLEEFTAAIKKPVIKQIPFGTMRITKAINAKTELLSPKQTTTTKNTVVAPRVGISRNKQARPRVNNSQKGRRIL